jgi:RNA polymerase primary sigma factor
MEKLITKSFRRLLDKGIHRGFITYEELGKSLGKRHYTQSNIEVAFLHIFDNKVSLVEKRSDFRLNKKKDSTLSDDEKAKETEKSDDPIRMYLREMGGVELLSREGEIAIAKRIEAGKDYILNGLFQSPLTAQKVFEWKQQLDENKLLIREIIDIDSSYDGAETGDEYSGQNLKKNKQNEKKKTINKLEQQDKKIKEPEKDNATPDTKNQEGVEDDEFNLNLK